MALNIETVDIETAENSNTIIAQAHFIKTVEDVYEALVSSAPGIRFGLAFNEASGPCLVRTDGNDEKLVGLAARNALRIGAGHLLVIAIENAFPINVMNALRSVHEVTTIYCATSNPLKAVVLREGGGAALIGVIDGKSPTGVESPADKKDRHDFLRRIGYKR